MLNTEYYSKLKNLLLNIIDEKEPVNEGTVLEAYYTFLCEQNGVFEKDELMITYQKGCSTDRIEHCKKEFLQHNFFDCIGLALPLYLPQISETKQLARQWGMKNYLRQIILCKKIVKAYSSEIKKLCGGEFVYDKYLALADEYKIQPVAKHTFYYLYEKTNFFSLDTGKTDIFFDKKIKAEVYEIVRILNDEMKLPRNEQVGLCCNLYFSEEINVNDYTKGQFSGLTQHKLKEMLKRIYVSIKKEDIMEVLCAIYLGKRTILMWTPFGGHFHTNTENNDIMPLSVEVELWHITHLNLCFKSQKKRSKQRPMPKFQRNTGYLLR